MFGGVRDRIYVFSHHHIGPDEAADIGASRRLDH